MNDFGTRTYDAYETVHPLGPIFAALPVTVQLLLAGTIFAGCVFVFSIAVPRFFSGGPAAPFYLSMLSIIAAGAVGLMLMTGALIAL